MLNEETTEAKLASILALANTSDRYLEALALLEGTIYDQEPTDPDSTAIDLIEALADSDTTFRQLVADAFIGGAGGEAVGRFRALQERVFVELGRDSPY